MTAFQIESHDRFCKSFDIYNDKIILHVEYDDVDLDAVDREALRIVEILNRVEANGLP
jgi:hypothetical protein